jgi:hypothetical protein
MMAKEGYKPTSGMQSAARRAIKLKEQGKATGAGTVVGWTRAGQLSRGETLSLSTVKRMYSYFSRHEVDKKGKDWDNAENPSNGKIMWLAWGGDAGFSWSRKIVEREKNMKKSLTTNELVEEIKDILDDVVNPADTVVEIPDDENIAKALRAEITKEQLGMVIEHLMEAIEGMIEVPEEESDSPEMEDSYGMYDTRPIEKYEDMEEKAKDKFKDVIKPRKGEPSNKELYARIVSEAKRKFDTYPSAYANGWVVQEYKRRGGKYNVSKSEGQDDGFEESEIEDNFEKKYQGCGCETCKRLDVSCENCPVCQKNEMNKSEIYKSDNEQEDAWDNDMQKCWTGYRQDGMKEKGGRMVPNCVPVEKAEDLTEADMVTKSFWAGSFNFKK